MSLDWHYDVMTVCHKYQVQLSNVFPGTPLLKNWFISQIMHQCTKCTNVTNAPDSGAPNQVHFIGKFHLKVPWFGPVVPGAFSFKCIPWWPPLLKNGFISQILHQCTRLWCTWVGAFHKQIPLKNTYFGPIVPGTTHHLWIFEALWVIIFWVMCVSQGVPQAVLQAVPQDVCISECISRIHSISLKHENIS